MIKKRPIPPVFVSMILACLAGVAVRGGAQELFNVLPTEPPSSLYASSLEDPDVEVLAQGFWEARVSTGGSWSAGSESSGVNVVPFLFTQTPDLYTMLRFRESWLFEAYVTREASDTVFTLGFDGRDDTFIQKARLGNTGIRMPDYPYMAFGAPDGSFGAMLEARDPVTGFSVDAILRWDGLEWHVRRLFGGVEEVEQGTGSATLVRGRRFILPDRNLRSLVLTDTVSGVTRTLAVAEYVVSLADGTVTLAGEPEGILAASWVDSDADEKTAVLYSIGTDDEGSVVRTGSVYEALNVYPLADVDGAAPPFVLNLANGLHDARFTVLRLDAGLVQVVRYAEADVPTRPEPGDLLWMRPFLEEEPWLYDDTADADDPSYSSGGFEIVATTTETVDSIVLDQSTVEGTVTVTRNGVPSFSFEYDADSGTLVLVPPAAAGEIVEIRYATQSQDRTRGAASFGLGARYPWLGVEWSVALGGRWPLFGQGYDADGIVTSAWAGFSLGETSTGAMLDQTVNLAVVYRKSGTHGVYRIVGMEDAGADRWLVPFRPLADTGMDASTVVDSDLESTAAFSDLGVAVHSGLETNRVLVLAPDVGATGNAGYRRYVEPVPLLSYGLLSFFIKADEPSDGSSLTLSVGDGDGAGVEVTIPLTEVSGAWHRISVVTGPGAAVQVFDASGTAVVVPGAESGWSPTGSAGLVSLTVSGLKTGSVMLDEILLTEGADGLAMLGDMELSLGSGRKAGSTGPWMSLVGTGEIDDSPLGAGTLGAGFRGSVSEVRLSYSPSWSGSALASGASYAVRLGGDGIPMQLQDAFSANPDTHIYAHKTDASVRAGPLSIAAMASVAGRDDTVAQDWTADVSLGTIAAVVARASVKASGDAWSGAGIPDGWMRSWEMLLPWSEASADLRSIAVEAGSSAIGLQLSAYNRVVSGAPQVTGFEAGLSVPFSIGAFAMTPAWSRSVSASRTGTSVSLSDDLMSALSVAEYTLPLWAMFPVADVFSTEAGIRFASFGGQYDKATYNARIGVELSRQTGYGIVDLFVPSGMGFKVARTIEQDEDTIVDAETYTLKLTSGAANLFAKGGARPLLSRVLFDEYSTGLDALFTRYRDDNVVLPKGSVRMASSFEMADGGVLALNVSATAEKTRTALVWDATAGAGITTRPERTWLGQIAGLLLHTGTDGGGDAGPDGEDDADSAGGGDEVSVWLDGVRKASPRYRETITMDIVAAEKDNFGVTVSGSYESRLLAGQSLTIGAGTSLSGSVRLGGDAPLWSGSWELSVSAKVMF